MAWTRMVMEIGMGTDIRGTEPTKAAVRALREDRQWVATVLRFSFKEANQSNPLFAFNRWAMDFALNEFWTFSSIALDEAFFLFFCVCDEDACAGAVNVNGDSLQSTLPALFV